MTDAGDKPQLGWLPVARLSVDPRYQRTLESRRSQWLIDQIVEHFDWRAFQSIVATPDGEGWLVIDGQHRTEAARRRGETHVPAVIVKDADVATQAAIFVSTNQDRVAVSPYALYHAKLLAADEQALAVAELCATAGLTIPHHQKTQGQLGKGEAHALGALQQIIKGYGIEKATLAALAVADAYRDTPTWLRAPLFKAVGSIVAKSDSPVKMSEVMTEKLKNTDPATLFADAARARYDHRISEADYIHRFLGVPQQLPAAVRRTVTAASVAEQKKAAPTETPPLPRLSKKREIDETGLPIAYRRPDEPDEAVTPAFMSDARRFAKLVRLGTPLPRLAAAFDISEQEARRRADALERH